ncbi:hypothetical protein EVAR_103504_1 [Eumeta japonica]|uniref:Uncharacterized protein n=1 Tax=Eumeta variegata TaxID=151549 RepID=A0A4C1YWP8_EUMVA|nr:hypothetical protein EVAR_103504_1 [Eumeta japonica]
MGTTMLGLMIIVSVITKYPLRYNRAISGDHAIKYRITVAFKRFTIGRRVYADCWSPPDERRLTCPVKFLTFENPHRSPTIRDKLKSGAGTVLTEPQRPSGGGHLVLASQAFGTSTNSNFFTN